MKAASDLYSPVDGKVSAVSHYYCPLLKISLVSNVLLLFPSPPLRSLPPLFSFQVNDKLADTPGLVNESPQEKGWIVKLTASDASQLDGLMSESAYQTFLKESADSH